MLKPRIFVSFKPIKLLKRRLLSISSLTATIFFLFTLGDEATESKDTLKKEPCEGKIQTYHFSDKIGGMQNRY